MPKAPREEGEATEPAVASLSGDVGASDASTSEEAVAAEHTPTPSKSSEATYASTCGEEAPLQHTTPRPQSEIDLCRRVVPLIEVSDDCCPICLDEYTQADPGVPTACG